MAKRKAKRDPGTVYLVHFSAPVCTTRPARHYIGWVTPGRAPEDRLTDHQRGRGSRICTVATERGITLQMVRTWPGNRKLERRLKKQKNAPRLCPVCNPGVVMTRAIGLLS